MTTAATATPLDSQDFSLAGRAFDSLAAKYDEIFTESHIGRAQRDAVWRVLAKTFQPAIESWNSTAAPAKMRSFWPARRFCSRL